MQKILGEILSISFEDEQPVALIELRDQSEAIVICSKKFHPIIKIGEDFVFEGNWSADISDSHIKLFFAEIAINNFAHSYDLNYWENFVNQFGAEELWNLCQDASENERNYIFCLNFHLAVFQRFSILAVEFVKIANIEELKICIDAAKTTEGMILSIAKDKNIDIQPIQKFIDDVNKETSFDMAYKYLEENLGKI